MLRFQPGPEAINLTSSLLHRFPLARRAFIQIGNDVPKPDEGGVLKDWEPIVSAARDACPHLEVLQRAYAGVEIADDGTWKQYDDRDRSWLAETAKLCIVPALPC